MHKTLISSLAISAVLLAGCVDTTGLTAETNRTFAGNPNSGITVTEFADFQCPACKSAYTLIEKPLLEKYGTRIRFVFKHFPLQSLHPYALIAAEASECAADQGKFWEFVDINYTNQEALSKPTLHTWAAELGMDTALFDRCLASGIKRKVVLADYDEGVKAGVKGTPTFFVNGEQVPSRIEDISAAIEKAMKGGNVKL
jgi:protein-disulfide isomerase